MQLDGCILDVVAPECNSFEGSTFDVPDSAAWLKLHIDAKKNTEAEAPLPSASLTICSELTFDKSSFWRIVFCRHYAIVPKKEASPGASLFLLSN